MRRRSSGGPERDLEFATQVQMGFPQEAAPSSPGCALFCGLLRSGPGVKRRLLRLHPAPPDGRLAVTIGDVAGKGMPPPLLMARPSIPPPGTSSSRTTFPSWRSGHRSSTARDRLAAGLGHRFITSPDDRHRSDRTNTLIDRQRRTPDPAPLRKALERSAGLIGKEESGASVGDPGGFDLQRKATIPIEPET